MSIPTPEQCSALSQGQLDDAFRALAAAVEPLQSQRDALQEQIDAYDPLHYALSMRAMTLTRERLEAEDSQPGKILLRRCVGQFNERNVAWSAKKYPLLQVFESFYEVPAEKTRGAYTIVRTHTFGTRDGRSWELEGGREAFSCSFLSSVDTRDYLHPDDLRCLRETQGR